MKFTFKPSPNYYQPQSTKRIMWELTGGLLVVFAFSLFYYMTGEDLGSSYAIRACGLLATSIISALVTESLYFVMIKKPIVKGLSSSFCWVTAIILTLMCPINISYYALAVSTVLALVFGKLVFGGFGQNVFNPAALGRAIIMASFAGSVAVDFATGATPTASFAAGGWLMNNDTFSQFIGQWGGMSELFIGRYPGAIGETSALVILLVGAFLAYRKVIDWKVPVVYLGTIFVSTLGIALVNGQGMWYPFFHLLTGGVMFGAIFMLTDPVTNPTSSAGRIIFAMGAAFFTLLIRIKANLPEGVLYSILLMNMLTPMIERFTTGNQIKNLKKNIRNAAILFVTILLILVGVSTTLEEKDVPISINLDEVEGVEGIAKGYGGDVVVKIASDDAGNVQAIVAVGENETPNLGGVAINTYNTEVFKEFVGKPVSEIDFDSIDTITGSTVTSKAVLDAAKAAQNGGGEVAPSLSLGNPSNLSDDFKRFDAKVESSSADGDLITYVIRVKGYGLIDPDGHAGESGHEYSRNFFEVVVNKATGSVESIKMTEFGDTANIGDKVDDEMYYELFKGATLDSSIDTITGCTWTSNSAIAAAQAALNDAAAQ